MGVRAYVNCRCYVEGDATPPPVPRELIRVDESGWLRVDLPWEGNEAEQSRFRDWRNNFCSHPFQELASIKTNWAGLRRFRAALERAGPARFPVLLAELPEYNQGWTTQAAAMLAELRAFRERADFGTATFMIDEETGEPVVE